MSCEAALCCLSRASCLSTVSFVCFSNEFGVFVKERFNDPELEGKGEDQRSSISVHCITSSAAPVKIKKLAQQWRTMSDASKQVSTTANLQ